MFEALSLLAPFAGHEMHPAAVKAVTATNAKSGESAALAHAQRIAVEFEEVVLRSALA